MPILKPPFAEYRYDLQSENADKGVTKMDNPIFTSKNLNVFQGVKINSSVLMTLYKDLLWTTKEQEGG